MDNGSQDRDLECKDCTLLRSCYPLLCLCMVRNVNGWERLRSLCKDVGKAESCDSSDPIHLPRKPGFGGWVRDPVT
ncbi:hypothetical protein L195_g036398 [Trifolium pratense]|uniref:Uncharacterized protein n=1 Tax=Trifolium pratense TaxID=57577 RepID=A0A2K3LPD7_TRIPR|nr:hypothetical protein L195_g036398 [Trifolium pratense]